MSPYNALSVPPLLEVQPSAVSTKAKPVNNFTFKLGLTTLIATVVYLPNLSQAAHSFDLKFPSQTTQEKDRDTGLLPKIVGLFPAPLKKLANLSSVSPAAPNQDLFLTAKAQLNKSYSDYAVIADELKLLAAANVEVSIFPSDSMPFGKSSLKIHGVNPGDTINHIAQQYQVSPEELIQLNKIKNSDMILIDQELIIPHKISNSSKPNTSLPASEPLNTANLKLEKPNTTRKIASTKLSNKILGQNLGIGGQRPTKKIAKLDEDPYIAGLRADIEKLRAEYRQQRQQQQTSAPIRKNVSEVNTGLGSQLSLNSDLSAKVQRTDDIATPPSSSQNVKPDLFAENSVALQLPPLPASEEYLPSGFDGYAWPAKGVLTSGYGWRWGRLHGGIDIAAPVGTPILAAASGEVISSGWNNGGYGNLIELKHLDGSKTRYAHNNRLLVSAGQKVTKGEQIAEMGSTGYSTGSHLHFEIHLQSQGATDPLAFLN